MKPTISHAYRLSIAVRFVIFGAGGLVLLFFSGVHLFLRIGEDNGKPLLHPLIGMGLLVIASLSILYGIGRWGRWLYLLVLTACPFIFLALLFGFAKRGSPRRQNLGLLFAVFAVVISLSGLRLIDGYYRRREIGKGMDK